MLKLNGGNWVVIEYVGAEGDDDDDCNAAAVDEGENDDADSNAAADDEEKCDAVDSSAAAADEENEDAD